MKGNFKRDMLVRAAATSLLASIVVAVGLYNAARAGEYRVRSSRKIVVGLVTFDYLRLHDWVKEVGRVSVLRRSNGDLYVTGYINPTPYGGENLNKTDIWEFTVESR